MKPLGLYSFFSIILMLFSNSAFSQEKKVRVGFGVSMGKDIIRVYEAGLLTSFDYPNYYIPIIISKSFRIEPEIGIYRYSRSEGDVDHSYSVLSVACGIFPVSNKDKVDIYYGGRIGIVYSSETYQYSQNESDYSKYDLQISPAIGGEYSFTDFLSLGGELQLNLIFLGLWKGDDVSEMVIKSKTLIFVRFYF